ncbi:MAG: hypothetical protein A2139_06970 [Desulfobacca sp. RBG_16_60_12]|nr:MAG: hypothetical protein A2139_06970 [Desulfobacca sp. RBG_16_60_12]
MLPHGLETITDKDTPAQKAPYRAAAPKVSGVWRSIVVRLFRCDPGGKDTEASRDSHTILALWMVVIATLGAIVAGGTAICELEAHRLERQLAWGHHFAITKRQLLLADAATRAPLKSRREALHKLGREYLRAADPPLRHNPETVAWLDLQAQEEFAAARALEPVLAVIPNPFYDNLTKEQSLQKRVAFHLENMGFKTDWHDPEPPAAAEGKREKSSATARAGDEASPDISARIWEPLHKMVERAHGMVVWLAGGVVLFVLALVFLTLSDILRRQQCWNDRFFVIGLLVAGGALVFVVFVVIRDFDLIRNLLVIIKSQPVLEQRLAFLLPPILLFGLLLVVSYDLARNIRSSKGKGGKGKLLKGVEEPLESEHPVHVGGFAGISLPSRETPNEFSRHTVLLIAITVFCSALCGLAYNYTASQAGIAAHEANRKAVEMHVRSSRLRAEINVLLQDVAVIQEQRARHAAAHQRRLRLSDYRENSPPELAGIQAAAQALVANNHPEKVLKMLKDPDLGVEADIRFPEKLKWAPLKEINNNWGQPFALWDAFSQRSLTQHAKACIFLGILAVLAMAIYLFAQAHSMGQKHGGLRLIGYGSGLLMIAVVCGVMTLWPDLFETYEGRKAKSPEYQAAGKYADGALKLWTEDYREAIPDLEKTIELRPNFTQAQLDLVTALANAKSSQSGEPYMSLPTKDELGNLIKHETKALEVLKANGYAEPTKMLNDLGFYELLQALRGKNLLGVQQSLGTFQRAQRLASDTGNETRQALIRWNLALAQLASGERREVDIAVARQLAATQVRHLIVSALSDLEVLAKYYCGLHPGKDCNDAVKRAKEQLVAAAWPLPESQSSNPGKTMPGEVVLTGGSAEIEVSPYAVRWRGQLPKFQPKRDQVVLIWYAYDPQWEVWRALPEVSGPVRETDDKEVKFLPASWVEIKCSYAANVNWSRCLLPGLYMAELYINGRLTPNPPETKNATCDFTPKRLFDLNVALCCPKNWQPVDIRNQLKDESLLLRGYQTPEDKPAMFVFTFYASRPVGAVGGTAAGQKTVPEAVKWAKTLLVKGGWIKGTEVFAPYDPTKGCDLEVSSGAVLYKHWPTPEGAQHVGVVLTGAASWSELCYTLDSMTNLYKPVDIAASVK